MPLADQSAFWGLPASLWDKVGFGLLIAGAALGVAALFSSLASSIILYKVGNVAQSELKAANLAFEKAIQPRILEQKVSGQALKKFSGVEVIVASPPEMEPRRTAGQIRWMLRSVAGWAKFTGALPSLPFFDGVVYMHHKRLGTQQMP